MWYLLRSRRFLVLVGVVTILMALVPGYIKMLVGSLALPYLVLVIRKERSNRARRSPLPDPAGTTAFLRAPAAGFPRWTQGVIKKVGKDSPTWTRFWGLRRQPLAIPGDLTPQMSRVSDAQDSELKPGLYQVLTYRRRDTLDLWEFAVPVELWRGLSEAIESAAA